MPDKAISRIEGLLRFARNDMNYAIVFDIMTATQYFFCKYFSEVQVMFRILMILAISILLAGCAGTIKVPIASAASFKDCKDGDCAVEFSFPVDSILILENASAAKAIMFAGKIFVIGDNFSNLWIGDDEDSQIYFKRMQLDGAPINGSAFDWEQGILSISWNGVNGDAFKLFVNQKGKITEAK